jgi:hypothetical protein
VQKDTQPAQTDSLRSAGEKALRQQTARETHDQGEEDRHPPADERECATVRTRGASGFCALAGVLLAMLVCAGSAFAGPWWRLSARLAPTHLAPGADGLIVVAADDLGDAGVNGSPTPVTITDALPQGLRVDGRVRTHRSSPQVEEDASWSCPSEGPDDVSCAATIAIPSYERLELEIPVQADEPAGTVTSLVNEVHVQGGEAQGGGAVPAASLTRPMQISDAPTTFGVEEGGYSIVAENEGGSVDARAGSHPFQLTSTVDLNETLEETDEEGKPFQRPTAPALTKDLSFKLPPGLLGNVTAAATCSEVQFSTVEGSVNRCPASSAIGVATATVTEPYSLATQPGSFRSSTFSQRMASRQDSGSS